MILSDDDKRQVFEQYIEAPTHEVDLGPLMYLRGAWEPSIELYVNGELRQVIGDYTTSQSHLTLEEQLLPGDTIRVSAMEDEA